MWFINSKSERDATVELSLPNSNGIVGTQMNVHYEYFLALYILYGSHLLIRYKDKGMSLT